LAASDPDQVAGLATQDRDASVIKERKRHMQTQAAKTTLRAAVLPSSLPVTVAIVLAGTLLLTLSAKISVPFFPVPLTFQTFAVLFLGFALGTRLASLTVLAYLAEGAVGMPVFAGTPDRGMGLAYMFGPTGGYLLGFLLAAILTGALAERGWDRTWPSTAAAGVLGLLAIYLPGVIWLGSIVGWDQPVLAWGLWPFLPGETLKMALLACLLPLVWKRLEGKH
jgi:biotin transport system substrate-specific component